MSRHGGVTRNTAINLAGSFVPLVVSLFVVPVYLREIGDARYGALAIVWTLFGYFGVFDFGLSRATTNKIARLRSSGGDVSGVFWTAVMLNVVVGIAGGLILFALSPILFSSFHMTGALRAEALHALPILALGVPISTSNSVLYGSLEGAERFGMLNALQAASSTLMQIVPLTIALVVGPELPGLITGTITVGAVSGVIALVLCSRQLHLGRPAFQREHAGSLARYGGWVTVTGLINPLLTTLDRLVLGARANVQAVARYAVAYNVVTRAGVLPGSLARTLFPRLSMLDEQGAQDTTVLGTVALAAIMTPFAVVLIAVVKPFLLAWVGSDVGGGAAPVAIILGAGIWINSLAVIGYTYLHAVGRPDLTARFHIIELAPYAAALWFFASWWGPAGAAFAWDLRVALDTALILAFCGIPLRRFATLAIPAGIVSLAAVLALSGVHLWVQLAGSAVLLLGGLAWSFNSLPPSVLQHFRHMAGRAPAPVVLAGATEPDTPQLP